MSVPLPTRILESLRGKSRTIKAELKKDPSAMFLKLTMPPQILIGSVDKGVFKSSSGDSFEINIGKFTKDGIVLPRSMLKSIVRSIKTMYLPGGSPNEESIKLLLKDETRSNASILVLPLLPGERGANIVSQILGEISGTLGISVILVETEPDGIISYGSILAEGYRFAHELLGRRTRTKTRPMVVLPTNRMLQSGFNPSILKSLRSTIIEGEESLYWVTFRDNIQQPYPRVLKSIGLSGTRATIFASSLPFEYEGVNVMVIRARVSGGVSYPSLVHSKKYENIVRIKSILESNKLPRKTVDFITRSIPGLPKCYSHNYICSWLSKTFEVFRKISSLTFERKCKLMKDIFLGTSVCEYTIREDDLPTVPPKSANTSALASPGSISWFKDTKYRVVSVDKKAGLAMLIGEEGMMNDRIVVPYSYVLQDTKDKRKNKYLIPGFGTTEYLTVSLKNDEKDTLVDVCCMERSFFMRNNAPFWKGNNCKLEWDGSKWELYVKDKKYEMMYPETSWSMGWTGIYKSGSVIYIVGERHGSVLDGSKSFIRQNHSITHKGNILFLGRPEYIGDEKEYMYLRLGIFACLATKPKSRMFLHTMSSKQGDIQEKWVSYLSNLQNTENGLRFIADDIGIQEMCSEMKNLPFSKFHSFTGSPVSDTGDYKQVITNMELKMNQYITYMGNNEQLYSYGWKPWATGGPPRIHIPKIKTSPIFSKILRNIRDKTLIDMYKDVTPDSISWAIRYTFHKLRTGIFVSIRSNGIHSFIPMFNIGYNNTYDRSNDFWFGKGMTQSKYLRIKNQVLKEMGMKTEIFEPRGKWFANNSLIGNMKSNNVNDTFSMIAFHLIQETLRNKEVGDCDFILNVRDFPKLRYDGRDPDHGVYGKNVDETTPIMDGFETIKTIPFLSFNTHEKYADLPFVDPDTWINTYGGYIGHKGVPRKPTVSKGESWKVSPEIWETRKGKAVFRGSATGYGSESKDNQRLMFAEMYQDNKEFVDYAITSGAVRDRKTSKDGMRYIVPTDIADKVSGAIATTKARIQKDKRMKMSTTKDEYDIHKFKDSQDSNRMILYIDGNAGAYRYTSLMREGFCILKVNSMIGYKLWLYPALTEALPGSDTKEFIEKSNDEITEMFVKKGDHIKVDKEGKNLIRILEWANSSPKAVGITRLIAENAQKLYNRICKKESLIHITAATLNMISQTQKWSGRHSPSKREIEIPKSTRMIIKTLTKVSTTEKEREITYKEPIVVKEIIPKMKRPLISSISREKPGPGPGPRLSGVLDKVGEEMTEEAIITKTKPVSYKKMPDIPKKRVKHSAISYLTRAIPKDSEEYDLSELI